MDAHTLTDIQTYLKLVYVCEQNSYTPWLEYSQCVHYTSFSMTFWYKENIG